MERKEKTMESSELQEGLFKAIQTIAKSEVNKMSFDKTLICTIKDNSNAAHGEYYVTDNSSSFYAYSEVTTYLVGETVFVKVPNGDFNNQKHIEGRYVSAAGEDYNYVSPYTQFVSYTVNLIDNPETEGELLTNANTALETPNEDPASQDTGPLWTANAINNANGFDYDTIYLKGEFKTLIGKNDKDNRQLLTGEYGLILTLNLGYLDSTGTEQTEIKQFIFSSNDMNGNPYDFETYYVQEKIFTLEDKYIKDGLRISNASISFYQLGGEYQLDEQDKYILDPSITKTFINIKGDPIPWSFEGNFLDNNLFVKNLDLQLGYKQEKINTDKLTIMSKKVDNGYGVNGHNPKPLTYYSYLPDTEKQTLIKEGYPEWEIEKDYSIFLANYNRKIIQIDKKNSFIEMLQNHTAFDLNLQYRLYQYVDPQYGVEVEPDEYAGENWKLVGGPYTNDEWTYEFDPNISHEREVFKLIALYESPIGSEEVIDPVTGEVVVPDTKHRRLDSADLIFDLMGETQKPDNEYLIIDCDNDGEFKIYNLKGQLINSWEKNKKRYLYARKANSEAVLRSITWTIPYADTMIEPMSYEEFMEGYTERERGYQKDEKEGVINYTIYNPKELDFYFRIKDYLCSTNINNTIYCTTRFDSGTSYESIAKTLDFCTIDYFGTEYKMDIRFVNGRNGIAVGEEQRVEIRILNAKNEDITEQLIEKGYIFDLDWYSKPEGSEMDFSELDYTGSVVPGRYSFLLNAEDDIIYGKRINEAGTRIRSTEDDEYIRIIEDTVGDQGDLNYTETRVIESDASDPSIRPTLPTDTRVTELGEIRRTETDFKAVPDLLQLFSSHIIRAYIRGREDFEGDATSGLNNRILVTGYFPVPVSSSNSFTAFEGPTQVLYDSNGANPAYYKKSPKLYFIDTDSTEKENTNVNWELLYPAGEPTADFHEFELTQPGNILKAPPIVMEGRKCFNIIAKSDLDDSVLWIQPVPVFKDIWDDPILNNWKANNTAIGSVVTGISHLNHNGKLSGVFLGELEDADRLTYLEQLKVAQLEEIDNTMDDINVAFIILDNLYAEGASDEQIAEQIAVINDLNDKLSQEQEELAQINNDIETCEKVVGLFGVRNTDDVYFKLTEFGDFAVGENDEIKIGYSDKLIQSSDNSSILLNLQDGKFNFNHENLIINPDDIDGAVIKTQGLSLHSDGLIETSLDKIKVQGNELKVTILDLKDPRTDTIRRYKVLAEDIGDIVTHFLEFENGKAFELFDGSFFELEQDAQ